MMHSLDSKSNKTKQNMVSMCEMEHPDAIYGRRIESELVTEQKWGFSDYYLSQSTLL